MPSKKLTLVIANDDGESKLFFYLEGKRLTSIYSCYSVASLSALLTELGFHCQWAELDHRQWQEVKRLTKPGDPEEDAIKMYAEANINALETEKANIQTKIDALKKEGWPT